MICCRCYCCKYLLRYELKTECGQFLRFLAADNQLKVRDIEGREWIFNCHLIVLEITTVLNLFQDCYKSRTNKQFGFLLFPFSLCLFVCFFFNVPTSLKKEGKRSERRMTVLRAAQ